MKSIVLIHAFAAAVAADRLRGQKALSQDETIRAILRSPHIMPPRCENVRRDKPID
jgi:hypothetical protein